MGRRLRRRIRGPSENALTGWRYHSIAFWLFVWLATNGCAPSLPRFVQNLVVPQALDWQHNDISHESVSVSPRTDGIENRVGAFANVKIRLDALAYRPKKLSGTKSTMLLACAGNDLERKHRDQFRETASEWRRLETFDGFRSVSIPVNEGYAVPCSVKITGVSGPSVILVPGTFDGRDALYVVELARLCSSRGYSVVVMETRNHGKALPYMTTLGLEEGKDILAVARWLKNQNRTDDSRSNPSVAVIGYSLGGWYAIRSAYDASITSQEHLVDGGVIAFHPPVQIREAVLDWNRDHIRGSEFTLRNQVFKQFDGYLKTRIKNLADADAQSVSDFTFDGYIALAARAARKTRDELYDQAGPTVELLAEKIKVPTVVYHAEDDPVVSVTHSRAFENAARSAGSPFIKVIIRDRGGHIALQEVDSQYYVSLVFTVLEGLRHQ